NYAIDTGFIVFNDWTYPRFISMLRELGVNYQNTEMGFSVTQKDSAFEYAGTNLRTLFARKRNIVNPRFHRMLLDITRFNRSAKEDYERDSIPSDLTLMDYLNLGNYGHKFIEYYILPMASAIWSASTEQVRQFNARFFVRFFVNHGLLNINHRPQWKTISGGSREYIEPLTRSFSDNIVLNSAVTSVRRTDHGADITVNGERRHFDEVVFACHSDQALATLHDATREEKTLLSGIPYADNSVVMHTDISLLPRRRSAWSSWNYLIDGEQHRRPVLTYNMNILQNLRCPQTVCVTVNGDEYINPDKILSRHVYAHPQFGQHSVETQNAWTAINGVQRTWFCGAYWRNGFHEDGVVSAERVVEQMVQKLEIRRAA
ncbi:MAG: FAD-dependent oxidoreductase, partial [Pseudomonadota bacterium]